MSNNIIQLIDDPKTNEITPHTANVFIPQLWELESQQATEAVIMINSMGGDVRAGMAIYDAIRISPIHCTAVVIGQANSIAAWILQACDVRTSYPSAEILVHAGTVDSGEVDPNRTRQFARKVMAEERLMEQILLDKIQEKNPGYTRRRLHSLLRKDIPMSATEALELGLLDHILE